MPPRSKGPGLEVTAEAEGTGVPVHEQHPALDGDPDREVGQRCPDGADGDRYLKRYVIPAAAFGDGSGYDHAPNAANVVTEARNQGVIPACDEVTFDGAEHHPDGASVVLTYSMPAIPAVVAGVGR